MTGPFRDFRWTAAVLVLVPALGLAQAVGTGFTYQGRLTDGAGPANGGYDLQFVLYDAPTGGATVGPVQTRDDILVTGGLFTVGLDFGPAFVGAKRWLEVGARAGGTSGPYTPLVPRQEVTPTPGALSAPWAGVTGKPPGFADDVDNDSGGDITSVTAIAGLTGGGPSGALTVGVSFGGTGAATTVARSDHNHFGQLWAGSGPASGLLIENSDGTAFHGRKFSPGGIVVHGIHVPATGFGVGVLGLSASNQGTGVLGDAPATTGPAIGVYGQTSSAQGRGVVGRVVSATTGQASGVQGTTNASEGVGVIGFATSPTGPTIGVHGQSSSPDGRGVYGQGLVGVHGETASATGTAVQGIAIQGSGLSYGIYGQVTSPQGYAGYFAGRAHVTGTLSKGAGSFKIDHPLAPEQKYLYHSFVESPDMMNVYNGIVTTDAAGDATVEMPEWFEALNRDFRYQLTAIGQFAQAMVAEEMAGNRFAIRTDKPRVKVSWQVTGIRQDAFAEKHRIPVEEDKPEDERGTYLHPEEWGVPKERGLDEKRKPRPHPDTAPAPAVLR